jgi:hypothetical protein
MGQKESIRTKRVGSDIGAEKAAEGCLCEMLGNVMGGRKHEDMSAIMLWRLRPGKRRRQGRPGRVYHLEGGSSHAGTRVKA